MFHDLYIWQAQKGAKLTYYDNTSAAPNPYQESITADSSQHRLPDDMNPSASICNMGMAHKSSPLRPLAPGPVRWVANCHISNSYLGDACSMA